MRKRRRGLAATEATVAGATLTFLLTMVVPTIEVLRTESAELPRPEVNERDPGKLKDDSQQVRREFKQLAIAILNYEGSVGPVIDDIFATVGDDERQDPSRLIGLNLELGDNAENYRQFLATVEYHRLNSDSEEELEYLRNVEAGAQEMLDNIADLQTMLDMLAFPSDDDRGYETEQEILEMILKDR